MTTSVLSSLKVIARPEVKQKPPVLNKRMKLINRLEQQKKLATCMLEGTPFVAYKEKQSKIQKQESGLKSVGRLLFVLGTTTPITIISLK